MSGSRPASLAGALASLLRVLAFTPALAAFAAVAQPSPAELERRVGEIVGRMTPAEKIGQLDLVPNSPSFDRSALAEGRIGGVLAFTNGRAIAEVQAAARGSRLGIPLLVGLDVLHGLRTMFPLPLGEAASFDPDLAAATAEAAGREAAAIGINWTFAPMADLARDPRWGRMVEGSGEDPLLGRLFTAARVRGFRAGGLAATLKHFAGYGAAVGGRDYDAASIPESELQDSYLPPFRAGIEAGAESVMSAFHTLNREPATASRFLLTEVLRERWRYDGFVVSDWLAVEQLIDHGVAADGAEAARKALLAGVDLDMASGLYAKHLPAEIAAGRVPEAAITEAARRVVRAKLRMGLFDVTNTSALLGDPPPPSPENRALARRSAADTIVLLKNSGVLPLAPGRRLAVIGGMAGTAKDLIGPHAALVRWEDGISVLDGLRRRAERSGNAVIYSPGCDAGCGSSDGFAAAVAAAREADVVVAVLGEPLDLTGEAASRAHLTLPGRQGELLARLAETGRPVVLVLLASRPIELGPVVDGLGALMMAWFPGTEGGNALADVLLGDVAPSAKLPVTWPRTIGQVPLTYDRMPTGRPTDPKNRFTLRYVDEEVTPLYPFGFGLTYTNFALSGLSVATPRVGRGDTVEVRVDLSNTGARAGRETVQLYVRKPVGEVSFPVRQLKAFRKVSLEAGARSTVSLTVPVADLGYTRRDGRYVVEPGRYEVRVGTSSEAPLAAEFEVVE